MNITDDLEFAIDVTLENEHSNITEDEYKMYEMLAVGNDIVNCIGIFCDILIIFAVLMNCRMKSRRNILLMYWAIFDLVGFDIFVGMIGNMIYLMDIPTNHTFSMCFYGYLTRPFKMNCVLLMLLLISTTVARLQFIKERVFQWCVCIATVLIYFANFLLCYYVSWHLISIKFTFLIFTLLVVLLAKEVNMCCKAKRDDPVSDATRVKINIVRIYVYNHVLCVLFTYLLIAIFDNVYIPIVTEWLLHLNSVYILIYLCVVDSNFRNAFSHCCKKSDRNSDATVVYNGDGNRETVDFIRV